MVIMAFMAKEPARLFQAKEIAHQTRIAHPTASKLLKKLHKNKMLGSERGAQGGYYLASAPEEITIADLIRVFEGPIALTECNLGHYHCPTETLCAIRTPWIHINRVISKALESITLSDLTQSTPTPLGERIAWLP